MSRDTTRQGQFRGQGRRHALRFTVEEIARMEQVSVRTIRRHIAAGRLPVHRVGSKLYITPAGARAWLGRNLHFFGALRPHDEYRYVSIRVFAAICGKTEREIRHEIDKGAIVPQRIRGRVMIGAFDIDGELKRVTPKIAKSFRKTD